MLAPLIILPLVFIPAALASPIPFPSSDISVPTESSARSLELVGTTSPTIFLDGKFDTEIAKRECVYIHDKYSRKAEHERKVEKERGRREAHQSRRSRRSGVTTVPVANLGALDSVVSLMSDAVKSSVTDAVNDSTLARSQSARPLSSCVSASPDVQLMS